MAASLNILALETSTERLSVALAIDGQVRVEQFADSAPHSERILNVARALLDAAGASVGALHGIAFGAGPGAFTGVRLGCGVAQGIALARDLPVVAVNSLQALAQRCLGAADPSMNAFEANLLAVNDARLQEVYYAGWHVHAGRWHEVLQTGLSRPDAMAIPAAGAWIGCGSAFALHADAIRTRLGERLVQIAATTHPDAEAVLALAAAALGRGEGVAPEHALPIYVRDKVALTTAERAAQASTR